MVIKNKLPEKISEFSVKKWAVAGHFKFSKESAQKQDWVALMSQPYWLKVDWSGSELKLD